MGSHIHIDRDGAVGFLTMERRERFNALDVQMAQDLRAAGLKLARDPEVRFADTADFAEGIAAFFAKRQPKFQGK